MNLLNFIRKISFSVFTVFALSLVGCTPDEITVVNSKLSVTEITATTATVGGFLKISDDNIIVSKGICWSTSTTPTIDDSLVIVNVETGNFVSQIKNLEPNTTYFVRAYASDKNGTSYGESFGFITKKLITDVYAKLNVTNITATTATIGGVLKISDDNIVVSKGICWSTSTTPTIDDSLVRVDVKTDNFVSNLKNLEPNTTYFVRAFASNNNGITYGESFIFFTKKLATVLTSGLISEISDISANVSGNVVSDGGEAIIERGICVSKFASPTIDSLKILDGVVGTGTFNIKLIGLTLSTKYYIRAYAKSLAGISYGNEVTFTTLEYPKTITDIDGNIYHTIKIGTQIWLVENLKTTKYNDGTSIPLDLSYYWPYLTTPAYCYAYNTSSFKDIYGLIYNWYAVNTGKLSPKGWHVPTKTEIEVLIDYLGGHQLAGAKLKESGNSHWLSENNDATNSSGFTALPGGYRSNASGDYQLLGYWGVFWSSSELNGMGGRLIMENISSKAEYAIDNKAEGFSVRCIRN